jgi:hypothetical protein
MTNQKSTQGGFLEIITLFVVFCVIVWYFKIDVRGYIDSHPQIKDSLTGAVDFLKRLWSDYLSGAGMYIWNNIIIDVIWKNIDKLILK